MDNSGALQPIFGTLIRMQEIPDALRGRPFTLAQAREAGIERAVLRGRRFRRVLTGVYADAALPNTLELLGRGALLLHPDGVLSHDTALVLSGLPLPFGTRPTAVHVSTDGLQRPKGAGLAGHRTTWRRGDVTRVDGVRLTAIPRTWCDLAASGWGRDDLVIVADAVLRRYGERGLRLLEQRVEAWEGHRGRRTLREALGLAAFRVDSPPETKLRLLLHDAGLPAPVVNEPIRDDDGSPLHTPDLSWPAFRYAVDYDGAHHFVDLTTERGRNRRQIDIARQESVQEIGWRLTVVTAFDLFDHPQRLVQRVSAALRERGACW